MCCSRMPLKSEEENKPFEKLAKHFDLTVICHTHLAQAQKQVLKLAERSKIE